MQKMNMIFILFFEQNSDIVYISNKLLYFISPWKPDNE